MIEPTAEMLERFAVRTRHHIALVGRNLVALDGYLGIDLAALEDRARNHDLSKYGKHERLGYVWLTWIYHCKEQQRALEVPADVSALIERALDTHRRGNAHHPEGHVVPDAMSTLDVVEMVCDWTAIAQETSGVGSARMWAEAHLSRWIFSTAKRALIFRTIDELDRRNGLCIARSDMQEDRPRW